MRIEYHLLANHLIANAKALIFAGAFFDGREAEGWLRQGIRIISREIDEQVLDDGGHFERSPMYHALVLEDLIDVANVLSAYPQITNAQALLHKIRVTASSMLYWLRCMTHPDGTLGSFNDCAQGVAASLADIEAYAMRMSVDAGPSPAVGITQLSSSGYVRFNDRDTVVLFDVGPVGPDYQPGHAHADTLSIECSILGQKVIVNGGTSLYEPSDLRLRERGTISHSTVQIGRENSSEVWSAFRVGRRAKPFDFRASQVSVCCSHDGYRHLPGNPVHERCVSLSRGVLEVDDRIISSAQKSVSRFILAPGLHVHQAGEHLWEVLRGNVLICRVSIQLGSAVRAKSEHAPRFGKREVVDCLEVTLADGGCRTVWTVANAHTVSN
jgi:uncharacterized heparinase superfamily protein